MPGPSGELDGYLQRPLTPAITPDYAIKGTNIGGSGGYSGMPSNKLRGTNNLDPATAEYLERTLGTEDYNKLMFPEFARANFNMGGELDLRNTGGDIEDPNGSGDKDTVNAILADGEFVMTKQAVKGLGDGDHDKGIENLYKMMSENENKAENMGLGRA